VVRCPVCSKVQRRTSAAPHEQPASTAAHEEARRLPHQWRYHNVSHPAGPGPVPNANAIPGSSDGAARSATGSIAYLGDEAQTYMVRTSEGQLIRVPIREIG
jgi:hypothetical protein